MPNHLLLPSKTRRANASGDSSITLAANTDRESLPIPCSKERFRIVRILVKCSTGLVAAYMLLAALLAVRYRAPYGVALKELAHHTATLMIAGAVRIYDPTTSHATPCSPDSQQPPSGFRRIDLVLSNRLHKRTVQLLKVKNPHIVRSRFSFAYQPYDEPKLHEFRKRYRLDEVVAGCKSELQEQIKLREWCRSQFRRQDYQPIMDNFDALAIMERRLRNEVKRNHNESEYDPCHFFPLFYAQVLAAMGHNSRVVSCGHGEVDVWSNQFEKWILMDAELNHHYELEGVPLSILELHSANLSDAASKIKLIRGTQTSDPNTTLVHLQVPEVDIHFALNYHRHYLYLVELRNDWWTNHYFRGHPSRGDLNSLIFDDPELPRPIEMCDLGEVLRPRTSRPEDYEWTLNQAEVHAGPSTDDLTLELWFETVTPNFSHFEITVDALPVETCDTSRYAWTLHPGPNSLRVRPVNLFGRAGIESHVELQVRTDSTIP